ncbi:MAG: bifunctional 5,10-methylenetetrahydrofolate dehydrogenase/5,10-methenyltetrahydrofolate cyclohydrolase [Candidatus Dormibacteraeota bacterium]|uniref:Bifunctional protein FolD n=1 Tax=Candidatus Aeolococcus gillhamiae TaxID=3127015 RepID=A0A2W5YXC6_9BACT|nr:bifunctional 5,10-methylenetetrahydrofolate dehydrogenase/5,10-methenyltetrahydrofolate cyclohydrolase [Candidatus Dormibacteraeota bacterium]PZR77599.1 MAG: bifunctional methylenetetrahydrofolate dehydrogenase/methenyltetrahydrofolate cyclohydrolase [Candidatus Dormibacter sp. RRmetagenome_bin12]
MSAVIIDGRAVAAAVREEVGARARELTESGIRPGLGVVLCGENPASQIYVRNKGKAAEELGLRVDQQTPPGDSSTADIVSVVQRMNDDDGIDGILVQLPLPSQIDPDAVLDVLRPDKDADGLHPLNMGLLAQGAKPPVVACTPAGCMEMLRRYDVPLRGSRAVVVGRSALVGRPMAMLLVNADCTVTMCHSRTVDLPAACREADILIAAIGRAGMITADYVKPGACVVDVGTSRVDGKLRGDVDRESVEPVAGWLTPVPGGVGPMTIAMLMHNTVALCAARRGAGVPASPR